MGAGLSSSAALEVAVGLALLRLARIDVEPIELALAAQSAEHRFVGTKSGLMDQMTAIFGQKDFALLIDCRTQDRRLIPMKLPQTAIVICDTGVKHNLAATAYNQRRLECEQAVKLLREQDPAIHTLRDIAMARVADYADYLPATLFRRIRHVVSENDRTLVAAEALADGDVALLGKLMNSSHESLRDDYEVSCRELDIMVQLSRDQPGVAGARMMGGGFGGSTVNLVPCERIDDFRQRVSASYQRITGIKPNIFTVTAAEGVFEMAAEVITVP
jgi:galactokinase